MGSAVSLLAGFGAPPVEPGVPVTDAPAPAGMFAALIAQAAGVPAPAAPPAPPLPEGVLNRVFVAEWCLMAPEEAAVEPGGTTGEETVEIEAGAVELECTGHDIVVVAPVVPVIEWAPAPLPVQPAVAAVVEQPASKTVPTVAAPEPQVHPPVQAAPPGTEAARIEVSAAVAAEVPAEAPLLTEPTGTIEETVKNIERAVQPKGAVRTPKLPAGVTPEDRPAVGQVDSPPPAAAADSPPQQSDQPVVSEPALQAADTPADPAPRRASMQLTRALERAGAVQVEAAATPGTRGGSPDSSSTESGSTPSGTHDTAATPAAARPTTQPVFTVPTMVEPHRIQTAAGVQAPTAPEPAAASAPDDTTTDQMVQAMRLQFRDGIGDAVVRLKPEHLGEVSISLRVEQQTVTATVHAEVASVRAWLESQEGQLRQGLSEQGLHLEKLTVREDDSRQKEREESRQPQPQKRHRNRNPEEHGEGFEILV